MRRKVLYRTRKIRRKFDPILKEIFMNSVGAILTLVGIPPREMREIKVLPTEIRITKTLRLDILTEIPSFIVHFEIQNFPDPRLPRRMFLYYVSIELWQEREVEQGRRREEEIKPIVQVVIWLGRGKPPPAEYRTTTTLHRYHVIDMRKVSPDVFLRSDNPYEVMLALLAGRSVVRRKGKVGRRKKQEWTEEVLSKVIRRLRELAKTEKELLKYIEEIEVLGDLFGLNVEVKDMIKGEIDITKTSLFREGEKRGRREGEIKGLRDAILLAVQLRFGRRKTKVIKGKISNIDDIKRLREIYMCVLKAGNWEELLSSLDGRSLANSGKTKRKTRQKPS